MRSVKTTGGLTRGRGFSETQRLVWLLSTPVTAEINNAMQGLTGVDTLQVSSIRKQQLLEFDETWMTLQN